MAKWFFLGVTILFIVKMFLDRKRSREWDAAVHRAQTWTPPDCRCIPNALMPNPHCPHHGDASSG
jgi:hypothetical protein